MDGKDLMCQRLYFYHFYHFVICTLYTCLYLYLYQQFQLYIKSKVFLFVCKLYAA